MNPAPPVTRSARRHGIDSSRQRGDGASGADSAPGAFCFSKGGIHGAGREHEPGDERSGRAQARCSSGSRTRAIEFVLLWFTDIEGHLKSFAVTPSEIEGALDDGMGFDGSSITGFNAIEESDMVAIPDPETFQLDAVAAGRDEGRRG